MEQFDHSFKSDVKRATTTKQLDRIAFNRVRSLARAQQEPQRELLLKMLSAMRAFLTEE